MDARKLLKLLQSKQRSSGIRNLLFCCISCAGPNEWRACIDIHTYIIMRVDDSKSECIMGASNRMSVSVAV